MKTPVICNSKGEPIVLNNKEKFHASYLQKQLNERFGNSLGAEVSITTLTSISKKISEQKFFEIAPADYLPIVVGDSPYSTNIQTFRSFDIADEFETGIINTGANNSRLASADAGVDSINIKVYPWAKSIGWTIFELEYAARAGNWDIVSSKEEARKRNYDLGIQRVAFLGARGNNAANGSCLGLLNQPGITTNTTLITAPISSLTVSQLKTFTAGLIEAFRSNCNRTAWPSHFIIPESDYNGLASQASPDFPIKSTLELLEESFKLITRNKSFKILPLAYGDNAYSGLGVQKYTLLNYDEKSLKMNIPLDYTNTLANSIDNFGFQNVGMAQFTGVVVLRPLELQYFQY